MLPAVQIIIKPVVNIIQVWINQRETFVFYFCYLFVQNKTLTKTPISNVRRIKYQIYFSDQTSSKKGGQYPFTKYCSKHRHAYHTHCPVGDQIRHGVAVRVFIGGWQVIRIHSGYSSEAQHSQNYLYFQVDQLPSFYISFIRYYKFLENAQQKHLSSIKRHSK